VSRDTDTSGYLASLGPKDKFNLQDRRAFRRQSLCEDSDGSVRMSPRNTESPRTRSSALDEFKRIKNDLQKDLNKLTSLPPVPRRDEKKVVFKHETTPRGNTIVKREETILSSPRISRRFTPGQYEMDAKPPTGFRSRKNSISDSSDHIEPPSVFRSRRSSFAQSDIQIPGSKFENFVKYSSQTNVGSSTGGDETPRFRSAHHFREARKQIDSEEIADKIKKTFENQKSRYCENASADITSMSRALRGSRLDPFEDERVGRARQRARLNHFSYGVSGR